MTTKEQRKQYDRMARLGCIICHINGNYGVPAEIHHVRRFGGKRENAKCIPLCPEHHRGNTGVHGFGVKRFEREYGVSCQELIELTEKLINDN